MPNQAADEALSIARDAKSDAAEALAGVDSLRQAIGAEPSLTGNPDGSGVLGYLARMDRATRESFASLTSAVHGIGGDVMRLREERAEEEVAKRVALGERDAARARESDRLEAARKAELDAIVRAADEKRAAAALVSRAARWVVAAAALVGAIGALWATLKGWIHK